MMGLDHGSIDVLLLSKGSLHRHSHTGFVVISGEKCAVVHAASSAKTKATFGTPASGKAFLAFSGGTVIKHLFYREASSTDTGCMSKYQRQWYSGDDSRCIWSCLAVSNVSAMYILVNRKKIIPYLYYPAGDFLTRCSEPIEYNFHGDDWEFEWNWVQVWVEEGYEEHDTSWACGDTKKEPAI